MQKRKNFLVSFDTPVWRIMEIAAEIADEVKYCSQQLSVISDICIVEHTEQASIEKSDLVQSTINALLTHPSYNHFTVQLERNSRITSPLKIGQESITVIFCSYFARMTFKAHSV